MVNITIFPMEESITDGVNSSIISGDVVVSDSLKAPLLNVISCYNASGSSIAAKSICYISGDLSGIPQITKAQADTEANAKGILIMVIDEITDGSTGLCSIMGVISGFTGLTPGAIQYLSDDTAGDMEETATVTSTEIVRIIGYALSATVLYFHPTITYIEVA